MQQVISWKALTLASALTLFNGAAGLAQELNLYTSREPKLVEPLLQSFTATSGIKVNTVFLKDGMAERVVSEGASSPADLLMAVDAGNLVDLVERGLTQPVVSEVLTTAIPAQLRDVDNHWFALSMRARVVYAAKELGLKTMTYEELSDPKWKGKICIRSGQHPYNTALISAYLTHNGAEATETWLKGVKANLARKAGGGDRDGAKDILGGICDIAVANSYYVGLMRSGSSGDEQKAWGDGIDVILPTFANGGTHVNVSGAAVAKHAPNKDNAVKLLEFLVSDEAQRIYGEANYEYPVKAGAATDPIVASFGALNVDPLPLSDFVKNRKTASELIDHVGFDH